MNMKEKISVLPVLFRSSEQDRNETAGFVKNGKTLPIKWIFVNFYFGNEIENDF